MTETEIDELPQRVPLSREELEEARRLWGESEFPDLDPDLLHRCLEGLRAVDTDPPPADAVPQSTGAQAVVDRVIAQWRAAHD